jgi:hypothetical protein
VERTDITNAAVLTVENTSTLPQNAAMYGLNNNSVK